MVATTLSLAMKPATSEVLMRQSPSPRGARSGAIQPAIMARILVWESVTRLNRRSKLFKNQITMVATRMMVKARCKKSLALSHSSLSTFFAPGRR